MYRMTFGECRDRALNLIHQEYIAGELIPPSYNNQADYLAKIPGLVNAAQVDLATTNRPIPAEVMLCDMDFECSNGRFIYTLPDDLWQRRGSGLLVPVHLPFEGHPANEHGFHDPRGEYIRFNHVRMIGNEKLILPKQLPPNTILEYYRYPRPLPANPKDTDLLDNVREAQEAVPYYVAAYLVIVDDAFLYASMKNEYEAKKASMHDLVRTEMDVVQDVYMEPAGGYNFWG